MNKVMVLDDVADTVEVVQVVLQSNGFDVEAFTSAKQALAKLHSGYIPDILLLDMRMPEMSGPQFCDEIRKDAKLKNIKVVFFTASSDSDMQVLKKYGALGYIFKPFDVVDIVKQIKGYLKKK